VHLFYILSLKQSAAQITVMFYLVFEYDEKVGGTKNTLQEERDVQDVYAGDGCN